MSMYGLVKIIVLCKNVEEIFITRPFLLKSLKGGILMVLYYKNKEKYIRNKDKLPKFKIDLFNGAILERSGCLTRRMWKAFFCLLFSTLFLTPNCFSAPRLHIIFSIYSPGYLGLLNGDDWKEKTITYLSKLWNKIKDDPEPSLLLSFEEEGAPAVEKGKGTSPQKIIEIAKGCEELGIDFFLQVAGPTPPLINISTCEEVFKSAPKHCKGIYLSEPLNAGFGWKYLTDLITFRNLCKKYNRKMVWAEHSRDGTQGMGWWGFSMGNVEGWEKMFSKDYADVIVPLHETNDPRVETLNMGACLGMWLGGLVREWGFSVQDWWWNDAGYGPIDTCPPDVIFRMCLEAASLGATYLEFEHMQMIWEWGTWSLARNYREGIKPFLELYKRGKIKIPQKDEILSFSGVAIKLLRQGNEIPLLDSCPWLKQTPEFYIPNYFYGEKDYRDGLVPNTPYGILVLFPTNASPPEERFPYILNCDGAQSYYEGKPFSPSATKSLILSLVEKKPMPLKVDNAYGILTKIGRKEFLIWLINSVEKEPAKSNVVFRLSLGLKKYLLYDRESGKLVGEGRENEKISIEISNYKLIEVRAK